MGNYFDYSIKDIQGIDIKKDFTDEQLSEFESFENTENLISEFYFMSKKWNMIKDLALLSSHFPLGHIYVLATDEDSDKQRHIFFKNGKALQKVLDLNLETVTFTFLEEELEEVDSTSWNTNSCTAINYPLDIQGLIQIQEYIRQHRYQTSKNSDPKVNFKDHLSPSCKISDK